MDMDEPRKREPTAASLAKEDLEALSVFELEERLDFLKAEIARTGQMIASKQSSQDSAESVFR